MRFFNLTRPFILLFLAIPKAIQFYEGSWCLTFYRTLGVIKREGFGGIFRRADFLTEGRLVNKQPNFSSSSPLYGEVPPLSPLFRPLISIIVPNFNHARYLPDRLNSIYAQTYENIEVILLDDCSTDESSTILRSYAEQHAGITTLHYNDANSGGVFHQWKKGMNLAKGDLVWIAESDDYCSLNFLKELVRCFQNSAVMLAFSRTDFIHGTPPKPIWSSEKYLYELGMNQWDHPFFQSAHALVKQGWAIKNIVPNVSSALFRHPGQMTLLNDLQWLHLRLCGDWIFYLSIIRGGLVAYSPHATNYYRQHSLNTSVTSQTKDVYYQEHEIVAKHLVSMFCVDQSDLNKQQQYLYQHWCSRRGDKRLGEFQQLYHLDRIWPFAKHRQPNIIMAVYALVAGGGETFPIMLANLLQQKGYAVTLLNCQEQTTEPGIRAMISKAIPLLELKRLDLASAIFSDLSIELVHSHHAWVDVSLAMLLLTKPNIKQMVTMHGMYELMTPTQLNGLLPILKKRINRFVYTAEKNVTPFSQEFYHDKKFIKINNALPTKPIQLMPRHELKLNIDDFVLCFVARAIPEKGWQEAINAVVWAQTRSNRKIQLLLIGESTDNDRLKKSSNHTFIHFLGFQPNIRDYFATADMGFIPSKFKGESAPLVLIDCLHSGKPVLASNIGEIRAMLDTDEGLAGELFDLKDWEIDVPSLGQLIVRLANDPNAYQRLLDRVPLAASKFKTSVMIEKYDHLYQSMRSRLE